MTTGLVDLRTLAPRLDAAGQALVRDGGDVTPATRTLLGSIGDDFTRVRNERVTDLTDETVKYVRTAGRSLRSLQAADHVPIPGGISGPLADAYTAVALVLGDVEGVRSETLPGREDAGVVATLTPSGAHAMRVLKADHEAELAVGAPQALAAARLLRSDFERGSPAWNVGWSSLPLGPRDLDAVRSEVRALPATTRLAGGEVRAVDAIDRYSARVGAPGPHVERDPLEATVAADTKLLAGGLRELGGRIGSGHVDPRSTALLDTLRELRTRVAAIADLPAVRRDDVIADRVARPADQLAAFDTLDRVLVSVRNVDDAAAVDAALVPLLADPSLDALRTPYSWPYDPPPQMQDARDDLGRMLASLANRASTASWAVEHSIEAESKPGWPATRQTILEVRAAQAGAAMQPGTAGVEARARALTSALDAAASRASAAPPEAPMLGPWIAREAGNAIDQALRGGVPGQPREVGALPESVRGPLAVAIRRLDAAPGRSDVRGALVGDVRSAVFDPGRAIAVDLAVDLQAAATRAPGEVLDAARAALVRAQARMDELGGSPSLPQQLLASAARDVVVQAGRTGSRASDVLEQAAYSAIVSAREHVPIVADPRGLGAAWLDDVAAVSQGDVPERSRTPLAAIAAMRDRSLHAAAPADRLRRSADTLVGRLDAIDGVHHDAAWVPGVVAGLADATDAARVVAAGHPELTPFLRQDLLGDELARSLRLLDAVKGTTVGAERFWPDRGTIGRAVTGSRTAADVLDAHAAPAAI